MAKRKKEDVVVPEVTVGVIPPKRESVVEIKVYGTAPYCQLKFSEKAKQMMREAQEAGGKRARKKKDARNFEEDYENAMHKSTEGWPGIPAMAFKLAMIRASKLAGFTMSDTRVSVFIEADGIDRDTAEPLVKINGKPEMFISHVRNATGVADLRARALWRKWDATVRIRFNSEVFQPQDIYHLLDRAGSYVGIGEGRADSRRSAGLGYGHFRADGETVKVVNMTV